MIRYRRILESDLPKICDMCSKHSILYDGRKPLIGFVAEDTDSGNLIGFILAHSAVLLEPFIAEHKASAVKLFHQMEGALSVLGAENLLAQISGENEVLSREIVKVGFVPIESSFHVFKRV